MSDPISTETEKPESKIDQADDAGSEIIAGSAIIYVHEDRIACDGGGGALGHPRVFYTLKDGKAECGYCDAKFVHVSLK